MTTNPPVKSSNLISLILLAGAALWSVMRMFSWMILSMLGYLLVIFGACQSIALKKTGQDVEVMYNLINYPDEVSSNF
jgi:hypothetical protein